MEASAVHVPGGLTRSPLGLPLLRLRSDDQLLALFRAGSDEAFRAIHDRYRQRLFAYVRQMLCAGPRQDAEDVLQDVFVRAYGALRSDTREVNVRAWLYRVAHNRCIDHLRRPVPPAADIFELSRKPLHDPLEEAQRRESLSRLVADIARLPEQQRSALLMREIDGMSYADLAGALDVSVPAIKSLLVRARIGLVEAAEARDADCAEIRVELMDAYDRGVKASSRARKHMKSCDACTEYRTALRGMRRSFAALTPAGAGPLAMAAAKLLGFGGAGGGAAAGGSAAVGGGTAAAVGGATACKVAAVVCTAASDRRRRRRGPPPRQQGRGARAGDPRRRAATSRRGARPRRGRGAAEGDVRPQGRPDARAHAAGAEGQGEGQAEGGQAGRRRRGDRAARPWARRRPPPTRPRRPSTRRRPAAPRRRTRRPSSPPRPRRRRTARAPAPPRPRRRPRAPRHRPPRRPPIPASGTPPTEH